MNWKQLCVLSGLLLSVGCSESAPPAPPPATLTPVTDKAALKSVFDNIAESGVAGSALAGVRDGLSTLNDPSLIQLLDQLEKSPDPNEIKQLAKQISSKL